MNIYNKMEAKFSKYAIPNMSKYLVIIFIIGLIIFTINPMFYFKYFSLNIAALLHGQVWRIFTFILYPPAYGTGSMFIFTFLAIYIYYSLSKSLIYVWNDFKFNFFFFGGIFWLVIIGILFFFIFRENLLLTPTYLIFSIFIAFSLTFPDTTFLFMFIFPIKAKYLALFEILFYIFMFPNSSLSEKAAILSSFINLFIFIYLTDRTSLLIFKNDISKSFQRLKDWLRTK